MPDQFLHGIEVVQIDDGIRPIQTVKSSIIGFVGTAPSAQADTKASATLGISPAALLITAKTVGVLGNTISLHLRDPGTASAALGVVVTGNAIVVNLATSASSVPTSTLTQIIAAIVASAPANALVTAAVAAGSTGSSVAVAGAAPVALTGGADEPFPLNTPVLVTGPRAAAALGASGTLKQAYDAIYAQGVSTAVVVRVTEGGTPAATLTNVLGDATAQTGVYALMTARNVTGQVPRILAAPGFTSTPAASPASPVTLALITVANRLRGVVIADGPNTTEADAITDRLKFGSDRLYIVDPAVKVFDAATQGFVNRPASAYVAGILSNMDATRGFWWSPSNQIVQGISGTARAVSFAIGSAETEANRLNEQQVATIIRQEGFRLWGNRSTERDPLWTFLPVRRTADMVYESIEQALLWAMDRPFSAQLLLDIKDTVQSYLNTLKRRGAILGGKVWIDPEMNSATELMAGKLYLDFDIEPPAPLEHLTFRAHREGDYYTELVNAVATAQ
jgi:phage tail sheath protein FI